MQKQQAVLIFDGACGFCTTTANYIQRHSSTPIQAHPWQFIDVTVFGLTKAQVAAKVYLVVDSRPFSGHEAFAQILILQRNILLRAFGHSMMVPPMSWLGRPAYFLIAKYRHKLPGGTPACKL